MPEKQDPRTVERIEEDRKWETFKSVLSAAYFGYLAKASGQTVSEMAESLRKRFEAKGKL